MNDEARTIAGLLASLNRSDALPPEVRSVDAEAFWSGDWTPGIVSAVTSERTILIGFFVNQSFFPQLGRQRPAPPPVLGRVFGLFRRSPDNKAGWVFYCLTVPQSVCNAGELVFPAAIPVTLRGLTPASASP